MIKRILILLMISIAAGCMLTSTSNKEKEFSKIIGNIQINNRLGLKIPVSVIGETVHEYESLVFVNYSQEEIRFPFDFGIRLFTFTDKNNWIEIQNIFNYYDLDPRIITPRDEKGAYASEVLFYPD